MPEITCTCGKRFMAARSNARYCSDKCRKRTKRSGAAEVVPLPASEPEEPKRKLGPIEAAAIRELDEAGRLESSLGQVTVALARRLDHGVFETGAAYSALSKEYEAKLAAATRGAGKQTAPGQLRDEVAERRRQRGA